MEHAETILPPTEWVERAMVDSKGYAELYSRSLSDPGSFWLEQARRLDRIRRPEIEIDYGDS